MTVLDDPYFIVYKHTNNFRIELKVAKSSNERQEVTKPYLSLVDEPEFDP